MQLTSKKICNASVRKRTVIHCCGVGAPRGFANCCYIRTAPVLKMIFKFNLCRAHGDCAIILIFNSDTAREKNNNHVAVSDYPINYDYSFGKLSL